jgi:hypothetical protein
MHVIRRAAAFAHTFVSLNCEQAAALRYLVRPASDPQGSAAAVTHTAPGRGQGGAMAKLVWLGVATMSVVAVTGTPGNAGTTPALFDAVTQLAASVWVVPVPGFAAPGGAGEWRESASLLLMATGFFGAALLVKRRAR